MENIWWIGLALGSGGMLLWPMLRRGSSGTQDVSPTEAVMLINRESALVLDVREENEFASGHIPEARNIPLSKLGERAAELRKYQQKTVLVNCQGGVRSAKACVELKKAGLTKLYNLRGGLNAWNEAKLPIAKG
jgi:rhodanese-related sulfurtransferase